MPQEIIDEFTRLDVSRQRKYQLRKYRDRKCVTCGEPATGHRRRARKENRQPFYCEKHRQANNVRTRERMREKLNCQHRNEDAESYGFDVDGNITITLEPGPALLQSLEGLA